MGRQFRKIFSDSRISSESSLDGEAVEAVMDGIVQVGSSLLSPPTEEELILYDRVLYFLHRNKSQEYCRELLAVLLSLHNVRTRATYLGFRFSLFWSENAISSINQGYSVLEQVLVIALFRWKLMIDTLKTYDSSPTQTLVVTEGLKVLTPDEQIKYDRNLRRLRREAAYDAKVARGEKQPDMKRMRKMWAKQRRKFYAHLCEIAVVVVGCLVISIVMLTNAKLAVASAASPLLKYTSFTVSAEARRYFTELTFATRLVANTAQLQQWNFSTPQGKDQFDQFTSRLQGLLPAQSVIIYYFGAQADGTFREYERRNTHVPGGDRYAFVGTPRVVVSGLESLPADRCRTYFDGPSVPPTFNRKDTSDCTYDPRKRGWYTLVANAASTKAGTTRVFLTKPYTDFVTKKLVITFAAPVFVPGTSTLYGVVGGDVFMESMHDFLETLRVSTFPSADGANSGIVLLADSTLLAGSFLDESGVVFNSPPAMTTTQIPALAQSAVRRIIANTTSHGGIAAAQHVNFTNYIEGDPLVFLSGLHMESVLTTGQNYTVFAYVQQQALFTFEGVSTRGTLIVSGLLLAVSLGMAFYFKSSGEAQAQNALAMVPDAVAKKQKFKRMKARLKNVKPAEKSTNDLSSLVSGDAAAAAAAVAAGETKGEGSGRVVGFGGVVAPPSPTAAAAGAPSLKRTDSLKALVGNNWRVSPVARARWIKAKMLMKSKNMRDVMAQSPLAQLKRLQEEARRKEFGPQFSALGDATNARLQGAISALCSATPIAHAEAAGYDRLVDDSLVPPPTRIDADGDGKKDATDWQMVSSMLLAAVMILTVYFMWSANIAATMESLVRLTTQATFNWVSIVTLDLFQLPFLANQYLLISMAGGMLPWNDTTTASVGVANDQFLTSVLAIFPTISFYGAGQSNAQLWSASPGSIKFRVVNDSGGCRYQYALLPDGSRNVSKLLARRCPYMTTQRGWFVDAPADMTHSYSKPYVFASSGDIGITAVQRFPASPLWGLEGVVASDYNLAVLAKFMNTIDFRGIDATTFFVESSGALLASSKGSLLPAPGCAARVVSVLELPDIQHIVLPLQQRFGSQFYTIPRWNGLVRSAVSGELLIAMQGLPGHTGMRMRIVVAVAKTAFFNQVQQLTQLSLAIGLLIMGCTLFLAFTVTYIMNLDRNNIELHIQKQTFDKTRSYIERVLRQKALLAFRRSIRARGAELGLHKPPPAKAGTFLAPTAVKPQLSRRTDSKRGSFLAQRLRSLSNTPTPNLRRPSFMARAGISPPTGGTPGTTGPAAAAAAAAGGRKGRRRSMMDRVRSISIALSPQQRAAAAKKAEEERLAAEAQRLIDWKEWWADFDTNAVLDSDGRLLNAEAEELAAMKYGRNCISKSFAGYDLAHLMDYEIAGEWKRRKWYLFYNSTQFSAFVSLVIALHLSLALLEAPVNRQMGVGPVRTWLVGSEWTQLTVYLEGFCYVVHIIDFILLVYTGTTPGESFQFTGLVGVRTVLQILLQIDYFTRVATNYTTGCQRQPSNPLYNAPDCLVLLLPYTAALRPGLLILRKPGLRASVSNFMKTLFFAREVLVLMMAFVMISSAMGMALLFEFTLDGYAFFKSLQPALFTMFTFIVTADNYPDVMAPPLSANLIYALFFIFFSAIGLFLIVSLFIAVFEEEYSKQHARRLERERFARELGSMVTFLLLDKERKGKISINTVEKFFNEVCYTGAGFELQVPKERPHHRTQPVVTLGAFRVLVVRLNSQFFAALNSKKQDDGPRQSATADLFSDTVDAAPFLRRVVVHPLYLQVILLVGMLQMWLVFQYGSFPTQLVDSLNMAFIGFYTVEMMLRVFAFKWYSFWNVPDDVYMQMGNRFDFFITMLTILAYLASRYTAHDTLFGFGVNDPGRVVLALPLFRLLTAIESVRVMVLGLLFTLPSYSALALQLLCLFYSYGVLGCKLFARQFILVEGYGMPQANFDSFVQSQLTLFQLLAGANWSSIMDAATQIVGRDTSMTLYFISFVLLMGLLFTNLLIGIIINAFSIVMDTHGKSGADGVSTFELMDAMSADVRSADDLHAAEMVSVNMRTNTVIFKPPTFVMTLPEPPVVPAPQPHASAPEVASADMEYRCSSLPLPEEDDPNATPENAVVACSTDPPPGSEGGGMQLSPPPGAAAAGREEKGDAPTLVPH